MAWEVAPMRRVRARERPLAVATPDLPERVRALRSVAVLGAHPSPERPACYVPAALARDGLRLSLINPAFAGERIHGALVVASLAEVVDPVDALVVFRAPPALPAHLPEILAMRPRPPLVWLQSGIRHPAFAEALEAVGIDVVQDRCLMVDRRTWAIGAV
jgi:predicted CoA-binding protein